MNTCNDVKCPFHGKLRTRGQTITGKVISDKMKRSATVLKEYKFKIQKYERFEKRFSKIKVHNPECIDAKLGNLVQISACRPISKTKHFVITKIIEGENT